MALIQVTPEVLNSKATEVRNLRSQHDESLALCGTDKIEGSSDNPDLSKCGIDFL